LCRSDKHYPESPASPSRGADATPSSSAGCRPINRIGHAFFLHLLGEIYTRIKFLISMGYLANFCLMSQIQAIPTGQG
jgi:hypothetical protein